MLEQKQKNTCVCSWYQLSNDLSKKSKKRKQRAHMCLLLSCTLHQLSNQIKSCARSYHIGLWSLALCFILQIILGWWNRAKRKSALRKVESLKCCSNMKLIHLYDRAAEVIWRFPILSWPTIMFSMLPMFSKLTPCSPIRDGRIQQFLQPWIHGICQTWSWQREWVIFWGLPWAVLVGFYS